MMIEPVIKATKARLESVFKRYDSLVTVKNVTLDIVEGEFLTLLGPSGSGKTTLLQILAGLTNASSGRVIIDGRDVTDVPPYKRDIGMVFQNYALFPHMSVIDNVAFPLKMRHLPRSQRVDRAMAALEMVKLGHVAHRLPRALSGGQQQRVALARALVYEPALLLMDEPLGALDRNLRQHMQSEISQLHKRLGVTTVYVTHDQDEALSMSDRVAVVHDGEIAQIDTVRRLYDFPQDRFIANFLGESNNFLGVLVDGGDSPAVRIEGVDKLLRLPRDAKLPALAGEPVDLSLRPERIRISSTDTSDISDTEEWLPAVISEQVFLGAQNLVTCEIAPGLAVVVRATNYHRSAPSSVGARVVLAWQRDSMVVMPRGGGAS